MQEKNKLIKDIKQLKAHYEKYEPAITALKRKYERATREKALVGIERDRLAQSLKEAQAQIAELSAKPGDTIKGILPSKVQSATALYNRDHLLSYNCALLLIKC